MSTSYRHVIFVHKGSHNLGTLAYEADLILVKKLAPHKSGLNLPQFVSFKDRYNQEGRTFSKKRIQEILERAAIIHHM